MQWLIVIHTCSQSTCILHACGYNVKRSPMFSYPSDFHAMSTGLDRASLTDCSTESPDAFKQLPERMTFRDDSGNSSTSSSLEHLPLNPPASPQRQEPQPLCQQDAVMPLMHGHRDLFDDRMWQSAGVLLDLGGYDTDNPHVPLHKTVCCALCRYNQVTMFIGTRTTRRPKG